MDFLFVWMLHEYETERKPHKLFINYSSSKTEHFDEIISKYNNHTLKTKKKTFRTKKKEQLKKKEFGFKVAIFRI